MGEGGGGTATAAIRIHVGGLGESVTSDDLRKIFSPLGSVHGVDFVRTKGRSFGYIDFSPASDKSLTKLFSTYNGCVWKGGRLRFEKAKEHYLARLKAEWEESAAPADSSPCEEGDVNKNICLSEKPTKLSSEEKRQLKIFFPRLRKVKSVPFSGTGKHKYSFQRVEARALPAYFCDCEDHFTPLNPQVKRTSDFESLYGGVNDEELNIMNSVMNRLFRRESPSQSQPGEDGVANEEDDNVEPILNHENDLDFEADEDNLIINVVSSANSKLPESENWEYEIKSRKQKPILNETQMMGDRVTGDAGDGQRRNGVNPSKKRKSIIHEGNGRKELTPAEPQIKEPSQADSDASRTKSIRDTLDSEPGVRHSSGSSSWSQKSSWKTLVATGNNSSFSVSNVLSSIATKEERATNLPTQVSTVSNELDGLGFINGSTKDGVKKQKSKKPLSTKKARKSVTTDLGGRNASMAAESLGGNKSQTPQNVPQTDMILESEITGLESHPKQSATDHALQECSSKVVLGDSMSNPTVSSQLTGTAFTQEDHSRSDYLNLVKDKDGKDGENENIAMKNNVDSESAKIEIGSGLTEVQVAQPEGASSRSSRGSAWLQKSSWTQLVSEENRTFSITQLIPGLKSEKHEQSRPNSEDADSSTHSKIIETAKPIKPKSKEDCPPALVITEESVIPSNPESSHSQQNAEASDEPFNQVLHQEHDTIRKKAFEGLSSIGEACSFMRNATSLKDWANAKKALTGPRKRKGLED